MKSRKQARTAPGKFIYGVCGALLLSFLATGCGNKAEMEKLKKEVNDLSTENEKLKARLAVFEGKATGTDPKVVKKTAATDGEKKGPWNFEETFTIADKKTQSMQIEIKSEHVKWHVTGEWKSVGTKEAPDNKNLAVFEIQDPNGKFLVQRTDHASGNFSFQAEVPGTYTIKFSNTPLLLKKGPRTVSVFGKVAP